MAKEKKKKAAKELRLEDILFKCRDLLRGKAGMADKRDLLLTLVFLKFIGEKFTAKQREIRADQIRRGRDPVKDKEFIDMLLNDPRSYSGVFFLSEDCRWESVCTAKADATLAVNLDNLINRLETEQETLKGALPQKIFTKTNLEPKVLKSVIDEVNKISQQKFHEKDLIGRVYEYFMQAFAINAEKEEGEFYTPHSIVELIAALIEPYDGTIYDPCCGSGGMFVQSVKFVEAHGGNTKAVMVYGQESQPETFRLAKMNLAVRGISHDLGKAPVSTFTNDQHPGKKMDYIMANPPFNLKKWRLENELTNDYRWQGYGTPPVSNANYAWILHILSKLNPVKGVAGFLLANGALGDGDTVDIRKQLIKNDKIEAIIVLPREMFYLTDISVTLWILNQNKKGGVWHGRRQRNREDEILFVDLRTWNQNIYEKKFVQFSEQQTADIVKIYQNWQAEGTDGRNYQQPELYRSVGIKEIEENNWSLVPSRYIEFVDRDTDIDYEAIMKETSATVADLIERQTKNCTALKKAFEQLGY